MPSVIGLHGGFTLGQHEPAACLIIDGELQAIYEEERFNRIKSSYGLLPKYSLQALAKDYQLKKNDIDLIVVDGITYKNTNERWELFVKRVLGFCPNILDCHHQEAHAAAAFYGSGYEEATAITLDAYGDNASGSIYSCSRSKGLSLEKLYDINESLGTIYTALTYHLGFEDGDEYKVMGLAPYSKEVIKEEIDFFDKKNFKKVLRDNPKVLSPFDYPANSNGIEHLVGITQRTSLDKIGLKHQNLAAKVQADFTNTLLRRFNEAIEKTQCMDIVYSGGVALNCSTNGLIKDSLGLNKLYISPVSSDRGLAYGCACLGSASFKEPTSTLGVPYYGKAYLEEEICSELENNNIKFSKPENLIEKVSEILKDGSIIGWFQGRSEAGARALGNRSILASAASKIMKDKLNAKIKYREEFRPFAPIAIKNDAKDLWQLDPEIDYSCMTYTVKAKQLACKIAPASVHSDHTSRLQVIEEFQNPLLYKLLSKYKSYSGYGVLLNTSFNLKGQPIVESPRDAIMTFYGCGLDFLIIGPYLISK